MTTVHQENAKNRKAKKQHALRKCFGFREKWYNFENLMEKCNIKTIFWAREEIHVQSHQNAPVIGPLTLSVYHETWYFAETPLTNQIIRNCSPPLIVFMTSRSRLIQAGWILYVCFTIAQHPPRSWGVFFVYNFFFF